MARFLNDQNKVILLHESGTYMSTSGNAVWIGHVINNDIGDDEAKIQNRFLGALSRNYDNYQQGPRDIVGTLEYRPQDFRIPFWAIGSVSTNSGVTMQHTATEINTGSRLSAFTSGTLNPPVSFTLEDSKQAAGQGNSFVRTINGVIPNVIKISSNQGQIIDVSVEYVGGTIGFSSGASTAITENGSNRPYLWNDVSLTLAGSVIDSAKSVELELNNNLVAPHYLNGSRDVSTPFVGNRDTTLIVKADMQSTLQWLYQQYYRSGSTFNAVLDFNADTASTNGAIVAGSQHATFTLSGCQITKFKLPTKEEAVSEVDIEIRPKSISAIEFQKSVSFNPF